MSSLVLLFVSTSYSVLSLTQRVKIRSFCMPTFSYLTAHSNAKRVRLNKSFNIAYNIAYQIGSGNLETANSLFIWDNQTQINMGTDREPSIYTLRTLPFPAMLNSNIFMYCVFLSFIHFSTLAASIYFYFLSFCYKLIQLFRVTRFIAGQYNTEYYGTFIGVIQ